MKRDPLLGPVLSLVIYGLIACICFLAVTLPFSAILGSDPTVTGGVIGTLAGALGLAINARGKVAEEDDR
jgi:hypothetical protein